MASLCNLNLSPYNFFLVKKHINLTRSLASTIVVYC